MTRIYQNVDDPGIVLGAGGRLEDVTIIRGGATYGRVLFQHDPCVRCLDADSQRPTIIARCYIEARS